MPDTSAEFERIKALISSSKEKIWFDEKEKRISSGNTTIDLRGLSKGQFEELEQLIELKNQGKTGFGDSDIPEKTPWEGQDILKHNHFPIQEHFELAKFLVQRAADLARMEKAAKSEARDLFEDGLPAIEQTIMEHPEKWGEIVKGMVQIAETGVDSYSFFRYGLREINPIITKRPEMIMEIISGIIRMTKGVHHVTCNLLFQRALPDVKQIIIEHPETWEEIVKLAEINKEHSYTLVRFGMYIIEQVIIEHPEKWEEIRRLIAELLQHVKGDEEKIFIEINRALFSIRKMPATLPTRNILEMEFLENFVMPVARSQKIGSGMIFESTYKITYLDGIHTTRDLELIKFISTRYLTKANVILQDVLTKGLESRIITAPISNESEIIKEFLENAPAYYIELYRQFKEIYLGHTGELRNQKVAEVFKDVKQIKEELFRGNLTKDYNKELFYSVLYFVFSCHDMTVSKENYIRTYKERNDRQSDVPSAFQKPISIKVSSGGFALKDEKNPVNNEAWDLLVKIAREVKERKNFNVAELGLRFMEAYEKNTLAANREYFMRMAYQHSVNNGESLPDFRLGHDVLMKYKEFVGDRLANDIIFSILKESMTKFPQMFFDSQNRILGKKQDLSGLAKQLSGIIKSPMDTAKKDEILGRILRQNGIHVENTNEILALDQPQLKDWLTKQQPNVIEKGLVTKIFLALYGDEYSQMQSEMSKYDFRKDIRGGGGKEYILLLSKRKGHCVASYSMGVCVAPDNKMWESPDFWPLIIFDKDKNAHGGAIFRTIEEEGNRYLVLSVQPASSILNQAAPEQVLDKIIQFGRVIAKKLKYDNLLIPLSSSIHSNRGSIQAAIAQRFGKTTPLKLKQNYDFSYSPYHYSYQEFYVAY